MPPFRGSCLHRDPSSPRGLLHLEGEVGQDVINESNEERYRGDDQHPARDDVRSTSTPAKTNLVIPQAVNVAVLSLRTSKATRLSITPHVQSSPNLNRASTVGSV